MARHTYGGGSPDALYRFDGWRILPALPGVPISIKTLAGVQLTDLLYQGLPVTSIPSLQGGGIPAFQAPDGVSGSLLADCAGSAGPVRLSPTDLPDRVTTLEAGGGGGGGGAVSSVNGKTGAVVLTAADVNADPYGQAVIAQNASVPIATINAAGDLIIGTANDTVARLGKGAAGQVLTAGASTLSWTTPSGGGGGGPAVETAATPVTATTAALSLDTTTGALLPVTMAGSPSSIALINAAAAPTITTVSLVFTQNATGGWQLPWAAGGPTGPFRFPNGIVWQPDPSPNHVSECVAKTYNGGSTWTVYSAGLNLS